MLMIGAVCKGLLLGYFLAGPKRDPAVEAWIAFRMQMWRTIWVLKRCGLSAEEVVEAFRLWQIRMQAYQRTTEYQGC